MKFSVLKKRILLVVVVLVFVQVISFILLINSLKDVDRVIAEDVVITSQWSEIKLRRPLSASQRTQFLSLDLKQADRAVNIPEIQLVDQDGYAYDLHAGKVTNSGNSIVIPFDLSKDPGLRKDRTYEAVRIRSDARVQCNKIVWHSRST